MMTTVKGNVHELQLATKMADEDRKQGGDPRTDNKAWIQGQKARMGSKDRRQCWIQGQKARMGSTDRASKEWDPRTESKDEIQ